jgi:hypothetical protein
MEQKYQVHIDENGGGTCCGLLRSSGSCTARQSMDDRHACCRRRLSDDIDNLGTGRRRRDNRIYM